jgi:release factor glutamine methyltransferase
MELKKFVHDQGKLLSRVSDTPELDAELLVLSVLKQERTFLYAYPEALIDANQCQKIEALILRRLNGEPIAYILGQKEFWSLDFWVTKDVLIPRPETEVLVECALAVMDIDIKQSSFPQRRESSPLWIPAFAGMTTQGMTLLDLGTGSGAIAISIAKEKPDWNITATDFSEAALNIARQNAQRHQVQNISFFQGSWFDALPASMRLDVIVSNPPYIAEHDAHLSQGDVRFEPKSALVSGADGLDDIRCIIEGA